MSNNGSRQQQSTATGGNNEPEATESCSQSAFSQAVKALSRDMPILMHGSGDVPPDQVNPDTVQLLSELTAQYIANLVDAALDAQRLLTGGEATTPPPPCFPRRRKPRLPSLPPPPPKKKAAGDGEIVLKKRPRRPDIEYWDEPLPMPKIVTEPVAKKPKTKKDATGRGPKSYTINDITEEEESKMVPVDSWVGVAGVDLFEQSRSRVAHVRAPDALGVQNFVFPICHDGFLYGKVIQIQASRRQIAPVLVVPELLDIVRTEGALVKKHEHAPRRKKSESKAKDSGDADVLDEEPEQELEEDPQDEDAAWPGLEYLLPVHVLTEATTSS
ncbi:expressed unknown protein [Seminavis robusta]|uniref:Uncharacterized protein n=1 Tax=Seminavis robusta TaxID=568900 RepID=A0A9N8HF22_9STRA|nr:expressed unknown protein [Seminavis robusta]|eukprot:Sro436_g142690.1 n/a (329) ;mRNA; f:50368-51354